MQWIADTDGAKMIIVRRFIAVILCITLVPLSAAITASSVSIGEFADPLFWKNHLNDTGAYTIVIDNEALHTSLTEYFASELPLDDSTVQKFLAEAATEALLASAGDPIWIESTTTHILDEALPYLGGESDSLTIQPEFSTRVSLALASLKQSATSDKFFEYITGTDVWSELDPITLDLTFADISVPIIITQDEVLTILQSAESKQWYTLAISTFISDLQAYLEDETATFSFSLHNQIEDLTIIHTPQVAEIIDAKIEQVFSLVPQCSLSQIVTATLAHTTPDAVGYALITSSYPCVPPGITYTAAKELLDIDLEKEVSARMSDLISGDLWTEEQAEFLDAIGIVKCAINNPPRIDGNVVTTPDLNIYEPCALQATTFSEFTKIRSSYLPYVRVLQSPWIHGISIVLAIVTAGIGSRRWIGRIRWAATFSMISGSMLLAIAGSLSVLSMVTGAENLPEGILEDQQSLLIATADLLNSVMHSLSIAIFRYGSVICLGGFVFFVIGTILQKGNSKRPTLS